jgi:hypothetical protein
MTTYLALLRIDWHVAKTPAELMPVVIAGHASLYKETHTYMTFEEELRSIASKHPALVVDALIEPGGRNLVLFRVGAGQVTQIPVEERPVGWNKSLDPFADYTCSYLRHPHWDSEAKLREDAAIMAHQNNPAEGIECFIAQTREARYLVELESSDWHRVLKLEFVTDPAVVTKLWRGDFQVPPQARSPEVRYEHPLTGSRAMLRFLEQQATRTARNLSSLVEFAWTAGHKRVAASTPDELVELVKPSDPSGAPPSDGRAATAKLIYITGLMLEQIETEALRLDKPISFVIESAIALARGDLEALPSGNKYYR